MKVNEYMRLVGMSGKLAAGDTAADQVAAEPPREQRPTSLLFGGTFNPPHLGHWELAEAGRTELTEHLGRAVEVVWVVAHNPYHKTQDGLRLSTNDRENLVEAVLTEQGGTLEYEATRRHRLLNNQTLAEAACSTKEPTWWTRRTYTIDVIEEGRRMKELSEDVWLLMGTDSAKRLTSWSRWQELLSDCGVVVGVRRGAADVTAPDGVPAERWLRLYTEPAEESSTRVRRLIAAAEWERVAGACGEDVAKQLRRMMTEAGHRQQPAA